MLKPLLLATHCGSINPHPTQRNSELSRHFCQTKCQLPWELVATGGPEDCFSFYFSVRRTESFTKEPMHYFYQFLKHNIFKKIFKTCNISIHKQCFGVKCVILSHIIINNHKDLNSWPDLHSMNTVSRGIYIIPMYSVYKSIHPGPLPLVQIPLF